jgi:hypothetical protein
VGQWWSLVLAICGPVLVVAFGVIVAALAVTLLPVPVWASRALRPASPHKALPPAGESTASEQSRAMAVLLTEVNTAIDLVGRARDSMADYAAAAPLGWILDSKGNDNWYTGIVRQCQYDELEAAKAVERVVQAFPDLAPELSGKLEGKSEALATLFSDLVPGESELVPGQRMSRRQARDKAKRYEATVRQLIELRTSLTDPAKDPYRV